MEHLGTRIRRLRKSAGLTQEQLAVRAGVVGMTVSKLERMCEASPRWTTIERIAEALGTDAITLMSDAEIPRPKPDADPPGPPSPLPA